MKEYSKYKNYPEGSASKKLYDINTMSLEKFLLKYYDNCDMTNWNRWINRYVKPAFDEKRHKELVENFGYVSINKHDFKSQDSFYKLLKLDERLDDDTSMFIGFMAGVGFFNSKELNIEKWFGMSNWLNPNSDNLEGYPINTILNNPNGLDFFKLELLELPFWKR